MGKQGKIVWGCLAMVMVLCLGWYWNRGYGDTSAQGYAYSKALFSACNQHDLKRLRQIESMIQEDLEAEKIGEREASWLRAIIDKAEREDWQGANRDVRQLMNDQVRPAPARNK